MNSNHCLKLVLFHCLFFAAFCRTNVWAQEKFPAEKIVVEVSNELLHPELITTEKGKTEVAIVIPTSAPDSQACPFRAWESYAKIEQAYDLLNIAVSYQISAFVISGEEFIKADTTWKNKFLKVAKEFNIKLILASTVFGVPLKKSDLDDIRAFASIKEVDILLRIQNSLFLNAQQTKDYLNALFNPIERNDITIYVESFGKDETFTATLKEFNKSNVIPVSNWARENWSIMAPLNPVISKIEGKQVIRTDVSLENFGKNEISFLQQDYIGFRVTQCTEASKEIQGYLIHFGDHTTSFGTLNAVNIYTISEFMLDRHKDVDQINYEWFGTMYGKERGLELLEMTASSYPIIQQTLYVNNSEVAFTDHVLPKQPSALLRETALDSWCKLKKNQNFRTNELFREKLRAKELVDVLEAKILSFSTKEKSKPTAASLKQIQRTKEVVELLLEYTGIFLQVQTEAPTAESYKAFAKKYIAKFPEFEAIWKDFQAVYVDQKEDLLQEIPKDNLPNYFKIKSEKQE